jgi:hypothetical protein
MFVVVWSLHVNFHQVRPFPLPSNGTNKFMHSRMVLFEYSLVFNLVFFCIYMGFINFYISHMHKCVFSWDLYVAFEPHLVTSHFLTK